VCVCVCVCVCKALHSQSSRESASVCVCVCVCVKSPPFPELQGVSQDWNLLPPGWPTTCPRWELECQQSWHQEAQTGTTTRQHCYIRDGESDICGGLRGNPGCQEISVRAEVGAGSSQSWGGWQGLKEANTTSGTLLHVEHWSSPYTCFYV
jgi:hypothetical protein